MDLELVGVNPVGDNHVFRINAIFTRSENFPRGYEQGQAVFGHGNFWECMEFRWTGY